jgi:hypothetical protein
MKVYRGGKVRLHTFLNSEIDGVERLTSLAGILTLGKFL